jgi:hypothetical protein
MPNESPDARRKQILDEIAQIGFCLPGSIVERTSRCGNPKCRCHTDPTRLHGPYRSWTRKVQGKTVTRRLTDDQLQLYQPWFDNARRLRHLVAELESLSVRTAEDIEGWSQPPQPEHVSDVEHHSM